MPHPQPQYPATRRHVETELRHGKQLDDPYAWLKDAEDTKVGEWIEAQQDVSDDYFAASPDEVRIRAWLDKFLDQAYVFHAIDTASALFMVEDRPSAQQPVIIARDHESGAERIVVGPKELAADDATVLVQTSIFPSPCGRYIAYGVRRGGGDATRLQVRDTRTGAVLAHDLCVTVLLNVSWHTDGDSFFYNQSQRGFIEGDDADDREDGIYLHRMGGGDDAADEFVTGKSFDEAHGCIPIVSDDGKMLFLKQVSIVAGVDALSVCPLVDGQPQGDFKPLAKAGEAYFFYIGQAGTRHYFETNLDAKDFARIVAFDLATPDAPELIEIVAEEQRPLARSMPTVRAERAVISGDRLYVTYVEAAAHVVSIFDLDGAPLGRIPLPTACSVGGGGGERYGNLSKTSDGKLLLDLWFFVQAPTAYVWDPQDDALTPVAPDRESPQVVNIEIEQTAYQARDGTEVPISLIARKDVPRDGTAPCMLYAYGGGGMAITPEFGTDIAAWTALGGVYALANIRGGGEHGRPWHKAGTGPNKQTSFHDFADAGAWLIEQGITVTAGLGIRGLSYGGMLMGVSVCQHPELFGGVLLECPLLDPLGVGRDYWSAQLAPEIGNPTEDAVVFEQMAKWSPLKNLREGQLYPPTLTIIADEDAPLLTDGAARFVATLQQDTAEGPPHLLHVLRNAGHGGWSKDQQLNATARGIAFLASVLSPTLDLEGYPS